jgi:hypothetical protein
MSALPSRRAPRACLAALASLALALVSCSETTSTSRTDDSSARPASTTSSEPVRRAPSAAAPHGDVRVIVYQPQQEAKNQAKAGGRAASNVVPDLLMILVNEGNRGRDTKEGRYNLALQDPNRGYKVMTEQDTDALIKSFENLGWAEGATPFVPGDEQYLVSGANAANYRGIIFVETSAGKFKLLGTKPGGPNDVAGQERYKKFVGLKTAVAAWFQASAGEMPVGDGTPLPTRLDAKK